MITVVINNNARDPIRRVWARLWGMTLRKQKCHHTSGTHGQSSTRVWRRSALIDSVRPVSE